MVWATLAVLGIPIWLVVGGFIGTMVSRCHFHNQDGFVPLALGEAEINKIDDPVSFTLRLDHGSRYEIAVDHSDDPIPAAADR